MKYVLISGKQGSGKTTLQNALIKEWDKGRGHSAFKLNFADILYEMHDAVLQVLHKYWPQRDIVKDGPLLQLLGTEWGRNTIDTDIWVKCLLQKAMNINRLNNVLEGDQQALIVVGDCRFENEFDGVPQAVRVRLEASKEVRKSRCSMWRDRDDHPSETGLDEYTAQGRFDVVIQTDVCTLEESTAVVLGALQMKGMVIK